ncbi:hypothetical protein Sango_1559300 [Sesamum angolense]|uniref:Retrotransposon gag domain-containing protein n=1 Tax=Sesamum angolense TaxID=2727404 RepID=A0AAE1WQ58_9LAMI|nr:hypothetical protein Sango_1559300 [Sesamum angolense]
MHLPGRPPKPWLSLRRTTPSIRPLLHLIEVENCPRLPRRRSRGRRRGVEDPYLALAIAPPRRNPFSTAILAEALPAGVKVSNLSEYDGTSDPQEHLDKFYAKIDWYDLSDAAYCKVFHTTLSKRALAWFNQLPAGTISSLEQLTQRFLHHFSMNKRVPKTAAFLFTIRQRENEPLRDYMQRFIEAVHEVTHINHELLASIIQQNLLPERFKESIAGKPQVPWKISSCGHRSTFGLRSLILLTLPRVLREKAEKKRTSRERKKNASMCLRQGYTPIECF